MKRRVLVLPALALALTGCSITQEIDPIKSAQISQVCVLDNPKVFMDEFQPLLQEQIQEKGFPTKIYTGARPSECSHYLEYTANWLWDMAIYLSYTEMRVYDRDGLTGQAVYDARRGGGRLDKFGRTADKLKPLVEELFRDATAGPIAVPATVSESASGARAHAAGRLIELQHLKDQGLITEEEYARMRQAILNEI